jgi:hypothetical protein
MTTELNRRTFIALLGATAVATATARPARTGLLQCRAGSSSPLCFMNDQEIQIPARPKTTAIFYLHP